MNPLIKLITRVGALIVRRGVARSALASISSSLRYVIAVGALAIIVAAVAISTRRAVSIASDPAKPPALPPAGAPELAGPDEVNGQTTPQVATERPLREQSQPEGRTR